MNFFKLLYVCLMSFIVSPFLHGMEEVPYEVYLPTSLLESSQPSSSSKLHRELTPTQQVTNLPIPSISNTKERKKNNPEISVSLTNQNDERRTALMNDLEKIRENFFKFSFVAKITPLHKLKEPAEKLRADLKLLDSPLYNETSAQELKKNISYALNKYDENVRKINAIFAPWLSAAERVNSTILEKIPYVSKYEATPLLPYPPFEHPLAKAFIDIDFAVVYNTEDGLITAIKNFRVARPNFRIISMAVFSTKNSLTLKHELFEYYLSYLSKRTPDEIIAEISTCLPFFLDSIHYQQQNQKNNELINDSVKSDINSQLIQLFKADVLRILNYLKEANPKLNTNIDLIQEIILKTEFKRTIQQACLVLLNKTGQFYPQIQSNIATTLIDDIATHYFKSLEKQQTLEQKNTLLTQIIDWLTLVPLLEPLFSATLNISDIGKEKLGDYLEKIELLQRNTNLSPDVREKLQQIKNNILKEPAQRAKQVAIAQARLQAAKKAQLEAEEKVLKATHEVAQLKAKQARLQAEHVGLQATKQAQLELENKVLKTTEEVAQLKSEQVRLQAEQARLQAAEQKIEQFYLEEKATKRATEKLELEAEAGEIFRLDTDVAEKAQQAVEKFYLEAELKELQQSPKDVEKIKQIIDLARLKNQEKVNKARAEEAKQKYEKQTPTFLENPLRYLQKGAGNILSSIQSWFNLLSWEQYRS